MAKTQKALTIVGRVAAGLVAGGLTAAVIVLLGVVSVPAVERPVSSTTVDTAAATSSELGCLGSLAELGSDPSNPLAIRAVGTPDVASKAPEGESLDPIVLSRAEAGDTPEGALPTAVRIAGGDRARAARAQSQRVSEDDFQGFAATACAQPLAESWLVAGTTTTGSSSLVVLTNPGKVTATVSLTVYTNEGLVASPGSSGIVVDAGSQRILSLNGLAPGASSAVILVQSRGGKVLAALQQSQLIGLNPVGVDAVVAVPEAQDRVVIPGVRVDRPAGVDTRDEHGDEEAIQVLRVFTPGDQPTTVTATGYRADGTAIALGRFEVDPRVVNEYQLSGLDSGIFTVTVTADVQILAAVRVVAIGSSTDDFAWFESAGALSGEAATVIAPGNDPKLSLYNDNSDPVAVTVQGSGSERTVTVAPGATAHLAVTAGEGVRLDSPETIYAAVSYSSDGVLASYTVQSPTVQAEPLTVYTR
ncbi:hypothetical protein GCM10022198_09850 [Klugiella xanthotipulae]|uniref:Large extracellular alpha-helical protein n=1 Tax=Klugiella xanthotipulae TaxID=244735 RepID=A0A543HYH1_9MICO|nr:DUF5719 family protein [Klugiella xanthotipulae]TQM63383.1 hypothetical protein FB466_1645 [Klugiella xanthotipulae]